MRDALVQNPPTDITTQTNTPAEQRTASERTASEPSAISTHSQSTSNDLNSVMSDGEQAFNIEIHDWNGPDDPDTPFNWSKAYKCILALTVCFNSILNGLTAVSYSARNEYVGDQFSVQDEPFPNLAWSTLSWNMGAALFPLVFVPVIENIGCVPGHFAAYLVFEIFLTPSAFARKSATLVITCHHTFHRWRSIVCSHQHSGWDDQ
jgi:hypothetical protein